MPRGEETQEVPQEGREESKEIQESKPEAQRTKEVIEEPQAVVEQERDVKESEQIEEELVKAVEAVPLETIPDISTAVSEVSAELDGKGEGRAGAIETSTELDGKGEGRIAVPEASADLDGKGESGSASTDIPVAELIPEAGELTPSETEQVELDGKGEGMAPPAEASADLDGKGESSSVTEAEVNPTPLPSPAQEIPAPNWEEDPPRPPQGTMGEGGDETKDREGQPQLGEQVIIEEELQTIRTDEQVMQSEEEEEEEEEEQERSTEQVMEAEAELQTNKSDDPIVEEIDEVLIDDDSEIIEKLATESGESGATETEGETDEGGSILVGEDGSEEIEQIDLTEEASKEVEEYWEPPEMYVYQHKDGSISFVDAQGNPIDSPPKYKGDYDSNTVQAWYQGAKTGEVFNVKPFPGYTPSKIQAYTAADGSVTLVDFTTGEPLQCPPDYIRSPDGTIQTKGADGKYINIIAYNPGWYLSTTKVYENQDGTIDIVDETGNLMKFPPNIQKDPETGKYYTKDLTGKIVEIPKYESPLDGLFLYKGQDGSYSLVDKKGKQIKYPPHIEKIVGADGIAKYIHKTEAGKVMEFQTYQPLPDGLYAYTSQDGTVYLVDKDGKQVESPPHLDVEHSPSGTNFYTPDGSPSGVEILHYQAPIKDIFIHLNQDGSIDIVDKKGKMIESPPNITVDYDPSGKPIYHAKYAGTPVEYSVQLKYYKPPSSYWDKKKN